MKMNSYQAIKQHLFLQLQELPQPLEEGAIEDQINKFMKIINIFIDQLGEEGGIASIQDISPNLNHVEDLPNVSDWNRMKGELETSFNVKMENGILIQENKNLDRDKFWWTNNIKDQSDAYYWGRYSKELLKILNKQVRDKIDESTDVLMNQIGDPNENKFEHLGMVVGHVQSGKTANYASLVCKAADAGYKFIVVITGDKNNLRNQTQKRLNEHFVGWDEGKQVGVGIGRNSPEKRPISLTGLERDFNKKDADRASQVSNFDNVIVPILIVIKKNTRTLTNVTTWLRKQYKNIISDHAMLLIDDESDYASINTKDEDSPTTINKKIRDLLSLFEKRSYVAYTATPYANILIDHEAFSSTLGEDLFPRDFIYVLEAPTNYFGAKKVFLEGSKQYVIVINDHGDIFPPKHKKDLLISELPASLEEAIRLFLINIAIRDLRGYSSLHNSMMIHATRFTNVHEQIKYQVSDYLEMIKKEVLNYGALNDWDKYSKVLVSLSDTFKKHYGNIGYDWDSILKKLIEIIESILVREVHQRTPQHLKLKYENGSRTNAIVIGGASISRGYTLEGLSISYFLRTTIYYDTLMQMGRWFGYRIGYEDLCKIFTTRTIKDNFINIVESTDDLFKDLQRMSDDNLTPNEFGLAIRYRPESALQVTARNKQRNAEDLIIEMKLDGYTKETARIHKNLQINRKNKEEVFKLIESLNIPEKKRNTYYWTNVPNLEILNFVNNYKFVPYERFNLQSRMPIHFIKEYIIQTDIKWDVALYSGEGQKEINLPKDLSIFREQRQLEDVNSSANYYEVLRRQVASGNAESVVLSENDREKIRDEGKKITRITTREKMLRPLLMLHFLELPETITNAGTSFSALGFSFPTYPYGVHESYASEPIKLKINTVYAQQLKLELDYENDADD